MIKFGTEKMTCKIKRSLADNFHGKSCIAFVWEAPESEEPIRGKLALAKCNLETKQTGSCVSEKKKRTNLDKMSILG